MARGRALAVVMQFTSSTADATNITSTPTHTRTGTRTCTCADIVTPYGHVLAAATATYRHCCRVGTSGSGQGGHRRRHRHMLRR